MKKSLCAFVFCFVGLSACDVFALTPQEYVVAKHSEILRSAKNPTALLLVLDEVVDYEAMAQSAMHDHWSGMTDVERLEFRMMMGILVRRSYQRNIKGVVGWKVAWTSEGDFVRGVAVPPRSSRAEPVEVGYRLRNEDGGYKVVDIEFEGMSLSENYRRQFDRIIKKEGLGGLLGRMREKVLDDDGC